MTFLDTGLNSELIKAIAEIGFKSPTPIQEQVIPFLLNNKQDLIALAQTGTGKTAAYGLPILNNINNDGRNTSALILCPTRELCVQISDDLIEFAKYLDNVKIVPVYGGSSIESQIKAIKKGVHIIVATPGRLIDLVDRNVVDLSFIEMLVLDEADEMLNMGFSESINRIISELPTERTTLLFSATMANEIAQIASKYMKKPKEITVGNKNSGSDNVRHLCYMVQAKDKYNTLKRLVDYYPNIYGIIFCRTRAETQDVADKLIADGYNSEPLHGDLSQTQRDLVMAKFRNKTVQLLVATDIAARGIDVDNLTHIINYNLPDESEQYTHRSGRTGRAGKTGISIAIINVKEKSKIKLIEKKIGKQFEWGQVPSGKEVCEKQLFSLIDKIEHIEIEHNDIEPYLPIIYKKLGWLEKEDLITRLVSVEFNRFLQYYRNARDLNIKDTFEFEAKGDRKRSKDRSNGKESGDRRSDRFDRKERSERGGRRERSYDEMSFAKLFINMGKSDDFYAGLLIDILNKTNRGTKFHIGRIELSKKHTTFEIESKYSEQVIKALNGNKFDDKWLIVKYSDSKDNAKQTGYSQPKSDSRKAKRSR
ncbi:MAG TPA: DEAD/DEAH box helicase [Candidatus Kapabacteria bacterium]|nr:DEAD/DEAH box helicase [Candidatus Kapabacteria bacterium]